MLGGFYQDDLRLGSAQLGFNYPRLNRGFDNIRASANNVDPSFFNHVDVNELTGVSAPVPPPIIVNPAPVQTVTPAPAAVVPAPVPIVEQVGAATNDVSVALRSLIESFSNPVAVTPVQSDRSGLLSNVNPLVWGALATGVIVLILKR